MHQTNPKIIQLRLWRLRSIVSWWPCHPLATQHVPLRPLYRFIFQSHSLTPGLQWTHRFQIRVARNHGSQLWGCQHLTYLILAQSSSAFNIPIAGSFSSAFRVILVGCHKNVHLDLLVSSFMNILRLFILLFPFFSSHACSYSFFSNANVWNACLLSQEYGRRKHQLTKFSWIKYILPTRPETQKNRVWVIVASIACANALNSCCPQCIANAHQVIARSTVNSIDGALYLAPYPSARDRFARVSSAPQAWHVGREAGETNMQICGAAPNVDKRNKTIGPNHSGIFTQFQSKVWRFRRLTRHKFCNWVKHARLWWIQVTSKPEAFSGKSPTICNLTSDT